jgi:GcrA cell cycle regulator
MVERNQSNSPWNARTDAFLRELWSSKSASQIALAINEDFGLGFTRDMVLGRARRVGLPAKAKRGGERIEGGARQKSHARPAAPPKPRAEARPKKPAKPAPAPRPVITIEPGQACKPLAQSRRLRFEAIDFTSQCRWPLWDGNSAPRLYCAADIEVGRPYCPHHCAMAYRPSVSAKPPVDRHIQRVQKVADERVPDLCEVIA